MADSDSDVRIVGERTVAAAPPTRRRKRPPATAEEEAEGQQQQQQKQPRRKKAPPKAKKKAPAAVRGPAAAAAGAAALARAAGEAPGPAAAAAAAAAAAEPAKKRQRKAPVEEKRVDANGRTVRYSKEPSQKVYERIQRALPGSAHRMFLIDSAEARPAGAQGGRARQFTVLGARGDVYTVTVSRQPSCTCPDYANGNLCKHVLFVMLRVLKLGTDNPLVWQRALLTKEVDEVLSGAHSQGGEAAAAGVLADERVREAYAAAVAGSGGGEAGGGEAGRRRPAEGDCPICFDELQEAGEALVWCRTCGNNLHSACFDKWARTKRAGGATAVTCVYCRQPWHQQQAGQTGGAGAGGAGGGGGGGGGGYLNLAQFSSAHQGADTSLRALYPQTAVWMERRGDLARMAAARGGGGGRRRGARGGGASTSDEDEGGGWDGY